MRTNRPDHDWLQQRIDRVRRQRLPNRLVAVGVVLLGVGLLIVLLRFILALGRVLLLAGLVLLVAGWVLRLLERRR